MMRQPFADMTRSMCSLEQRANPSLDHLVDLAEERRRDGEANSFAVLR